MISIIISSYQNSYYEKLKKNIEKTCGVEYEIIKINNTDKTPITEVYNLGGKRAKYPYFLFIHEDILFHTEDWGIKLLNHLNQKDTGIIGVAGSSYIVNVPSSWFLTDCDFVHTSFIQNTRTGDRSVKRNLNIQSNRTEVFKLDGMFLGMRREVFNKFQFNEKIKGFHGYDTDISLRIANRYRNFVVADIIVEHFSGGKLTHEWIDTHLYIRRHTPHPKMSFYDEKLETDMFIFYSSLLFDNLKFSIPTIIKSLTFFPRKPSITSIKKNLRFYIKIVIKNVQYYSFKIKKGFS
ncbi:glycosyltransferase [Riemerella anatipestifer]|nr:glycosyltransferase [Riemerella anatipestifer]MDY3535724.1 glycosyltransferase [Riemerella anatipestifer]